MGNQSSRQMTYEQYYEALKSTNPYAASQLDVGDLDPYEVLGVSKNFTWDELKESYRRIARLVHPDKGGSHKVFQLVTSSFKMLAHQYKARQDDRLHHELKQDAQRYYEDNPVKASHKTYGSKEDGNFLDRFNRAFEENRLDDEDGTSVGYGNMMAPSSKTREEISVPRTLQKFSHDKFNTVFDQKTLSSMSKEVVKYKEPEALPLAKKIQYTEIGGDKPDDFSCGEGKNKQTLQYTDYMKAHTTTRLVDPRSVEERQQFKNVQAFESARAAAMARPATEEELQYRAEQQRIAEQKEADRLRRVAERDRLASMHHDKMTRLFLQ